MKYSELLKVIVLSSLVFTGLTLAEKSKAEVIDMDYKVFGAQLLTKGDLK